MRAEGKKEVKARKGDEHRKVHEASHPSEPERMLKECIEAATEELSKKENELDEVKQKNGMIETQRNKKKSEARKEVEKIKKKKNNKDEDLRTHTEKDDGRTKRRILKHAGKSSRSKEDRIGNYEKKNAKTES